MEAKDTVISEDDHDSYYLNPDECDTESLCRDQAEITWNIAFKVGQENERAKHNLAYCKEHKLYHDVIN